MSHCKIASGYNNSIQPQRLHVKISVALKDALENTVFLFVAGSFLWAPFVAIWGWVRWAKRRRRQSRPLDTSFVGFAFTSCAYLLLFLPLIDAQIGSGPLRQAIAPIGVALSGIGLLLALCGAWWPGSLRWHAIVSGLGMFLLWCLVYSVATIGPGF